MDVPIFDELPPVSGMPPGCAWGVFDKGGTKDLLGTINHLTPAVRKAAAAEVKDGVSISLNAPISALDHIPIPGRRKLAHEPFAVVHGLGWDENLTFNTQASSQWDSLCHWQHQSSGLAYNGFKPTVEKLSGNAPEDDTLPTLDHWHANGGLVARGVLIDFKAWADDQAIDFHPYEGYSITVDQIEAVARHQGVEFRPGDVFIIRLGVPKIIAQPFETLIPYMVKQKVSGVESSVRSARWFWDHKFAAVVSDSNGFEAVDAANLNLVLHEHFLGLFGLPIGELWDLEKLAEHAKTSGRYTFMITSAPLNVPHLVGSPPNALAIF